MQRSASCDTRHLPSGYERDKGGGVPDTLHPNRDGFIAMYRAIDFPSLVHPLMCGTTGASLAAVTYVLVAEGTCAETPSHTYGGDDSSDANWELSGNEHVCRAKCSLLPSCTGYDFSLQGRGFYPADPTKPNGPPIAFTGAAAGAAAVPAAAASSNLAAARRAAPRAALANDPS